MSLRTWWVVAGTVAWLGWASQPPTVPQMATFNIENFPREADQPARAARAIGELGVPVVAVQEIRSPGKLVSAMHREVGPWWRYITHTGGSHRVGLLVDARSYVITNVIVHDDVRVIRGGRPALEVRVRHVRGFAEQAVVVVHLKSGPGAEATRRAQLQALVPHVAGRRMPVTVLGDFNPVSDEDRRMLDRFASATGLAWNSRSLGCTAYFPDGERCRGVALDHVMSVAPGRTVAEGPCATEGCDPGDRCPTWVGEVSDHCPVVFNPRPGLRPPRGE